MRRIIRQGDTQTIEFRKEDFPKDADIGMFRLAL